MIRMTETMRQLMELAGDEITKLAERADAPPKELGGFPIEAIGFRDADVVVDALIVADPEFPILSELIREAVRRTIGEGIAKGGFRQLQRVHVMREAIERLEGPADDYGCMAPDFDFEDDGGGS